MAAKVVEVVKILTRHLSVVKVDLERQVVAVEVAEQQMLQPSLLLDQVMVAMDS
jgi:hypothetical protein